MVHGLLALPASGAAELDDEWWGVMSALLDLSGKELGLLTVVSRAGANQHKKTLWLCKCRCGAEVTRRSAALLHHPLTRSCGCDKLSDLTKAREGRCRASARYRERNPEKVKEAQKEYDRRPDRKARQAERVRAARLKSEKFSIYCKEYRSRPEVKARRIAANKTPERLAYLKQWRQTDSYKAYRRSYVAAIRKTPRGTINNRMQSGIRRGLVCGKGGVKWESLVGYTVDMLRSHIERQFLRGMSWDNVEKWHIDHIIPLCSFNFTSYDDAEFRRAWALTNLRPLWKSKNILKGSRRETLL